MTIEQKPNHAFARSHSNGGLGISNTANNSVWCMCCGFEQKLSVTGPSLTHCPRCMSSAWANTQCICKKCGDPFGYANIPNAKLTSGAQTAVVAGNFVEIPSCLCTGSDEENITYWQWGFISCIAVEVIAWNVFQYLGRV